MKSLRKSIPVTYPLLSYAPLPALLSFPCISPAVVKPFRNSRYPRVCTTNFCLWWTLYKNMVNCLEHEVCCYNRKCRGCVIMIFNLDNVVGVRAGRRRNCGSIPGRANNFFFQIVDIGCGAHAMGAGGSNPTSSRH